MQKKTETKPWLDDICTANNTIKDDWHKIMRESISIESAINIRKIIDSNMQDTVK